jgi:hypothetical protein
VYEQYDLATLEDELVDIFERNRLGAFDGNEVGPTETILYLYGPDARSSRESSRRFAQTRFVRMPGSQIRSGAPGTPTTEVLIPKRT